MEIHALALLSLTTLMPKPTKRRQPHTPVSMASCRDCNIILGAHSASLAIMALTRPKTCIIEVLTTGLLVANALDGIRRLQSVIFVERLQSVLLAEG